MMNSWIVTFTVFGKSFLYGKKRKKRSVSWKVYVYNVNKSLGRTQDIIRICCIAVLAAVKLLSVMSVALGLLVQFIYLFLIDFSITFMYILIYRLITELTCVSLKNKHFNILF